MANEVEHLVIVDIEFDFENAVPRPILMYNEFFPPIIDKYKKLDPNERSVFQLCELYSENGEYIPKSQATFFPKMFIPLYLENLKILITTFVSKVTKLSSHLYFE